MEKNEITFSYFLENKIYFSQEMINLVETFYLNLKMHSQDQNTSFSKKSLDYGLDLIIFCRIHFL